MFHDSLLSVSEADEHRLVGLDKYLTANVFDINAAKRLCRSVICTFDVNAFGISFAFDVVTGLDAFDCDVLHDVSLML